MNEKNRTHYQVLRVKKDASIDEIRSSYRSRVFETHPDRSPGKEEEFKKVTNAFKVLSNPTDREEYDQTIEPVKTQPRMDPTRFGEAIVDQSRVSDIVGTRGEKLKQQQQSQGHGGFGFGDQEDERAKFRAHVRTRMPHESQAELQQRMQARQATHVIKVGTGIPKSVMMIGGFCVTVGALYVMIR